MAEVRVKENESLDLVALDNTVKKSSEDIVTDLVSAETCSEFDAIAAEFNLNQNKCFHRMVSPMIFLLQI